MVVAIVQARMSSSRLPGKVLADVAGKPLLERVIERVQACKHVDRVVVATSTSSSDDLIAMWCNNYGVNIYRGSEKDVLDRFWQCAKLYQSEFIVRVTADDPLKDPQIISEAVQLCASGSDIAYASNTLEPSYPEGLDIEVVRYWALQQAAAEAKLPSEREHVFPYIWKQPERFSIRSFAMHPNLSHWSWTVDVPADLEFVRSVFANFRDQPLVSYKSIIRWLQLHPEIVQINSGRLRNEGYWKSLREDSAK